jgi:methylmalonyl-CoA/ethylmalonyl-CoA epimerase
VPVGAANPTLPLAALGAPIGQIGIVVEDLDRALSANQAILGATKFDVHVMGPDSFTEVIHRDAPSTSEIRVALSRTTPQVELIEPLSGRGIHREFLEQHGEGMHHLGFFVEDVESVTARLAAAGHAPVFHGRGFGKRRDGAFAYYDLSRETGYWVEAIQWPSGA